MNIPTECRNFLSVFRIIRSRTVPRQRQLYGAVGNGSERRVFHSESVTDVFTLIFYQRNEVLFPLQSFKNRPPQLESRRSIFVEKLDKPCICQRVGQQSIAAGYDFGLRKICCRDKKILRHTVIIRVRIAGVFQYKFYRACDFLFKRKNPPSLKIFIKPSLHFRFKNTGKHLLKYAYRAFPVMLALYPFLFQRHSRFSVRVISKFDYFTVRT